MRLNWGAGMECPWGGITGYTDQGSRFLCRTYFDKEIFDDLEREDCRDIEDKRIVIIETGYKKSNLDGIAFFV